MDAFPYPADRHEATSATFETNAAASRAFLSSDRASFNPVISQGAPSGTAIGAAEHACIVNAMSAAARRGSTI